MYYTVSDVSDPQNPVLLATTWYYYDSPDDPNPPPKWGNPTRIVTEEADYLGEYTTTRFKYDQARRVVFIMGETWEDGESCQDQHYEVTYVHEFRYEYDQPRARYMEATRDCEDPEDVVDTVWTDYMGGTVYGDFTVVEDEGSPVYTDLNAFLPGVGRVDPHGTPSAVEYYHSNQIGTTRAMTDDGGDDEQGVVYTAFGERVGGTDHRYGYAGAWGYRSHDDFACDAQSPESQFPYLHVGYRYYDPATGRFLQRDPIGIEGGLNVYAYVHNGPTIRIDPDGLRYHPPGATGPPDKGFTDGFWSKVHYTAGWVAGKAGLSFGTTMCAAIRWELWEPTRWPFEFKESKLNQLGDILVALKGWVDAYFYVH